jgi:predicted nucleotidyltransferase
MKKEIIKNTKKWGNSAGVLLPREWKDKEVKVILIDRSSDIKNETLDILENYLKDILGIYIVGSYARGEERSDSDIDILVITNSINKEIKKGKYSLILISKESLDKSIKKNISLLAMIKEAKPILNKQLIKEYKKIKINKNLKWHINSTKSSLRIIKKFLKLEEKIPGSITYSLILRLRQVYIVDCLKKNKIPKTEGLIKLIKRLAGSKKPYGDYLKEKQNKKSENIRKQSAEKIYNYIKKRISEQEKWE